MCRGSSALLSITVIDRDRISYFWASKAPIKQRLRKTRFSAGRWFTSGLLTLFEDTCLKLSRHVSEFALTKKADRSPVGISRSIHFDKISRKVLQKQSFSRGIVFANDSFRKV